MERSNVQTVTTNTYPSMIRCCVTVGGAVSVQRTVLIICLFVRQCHWPGVCPDSRCSSFDLSQNFGVRSPVLKNIQDLTLS